MNRPISHESHDPDTPSATAAEDLKDQEKRTTEKVISRFTSWLNENGAVFEKFSIVVDSVTQERSVVALEEISEKEYVLKIPNKLILTSERAKTETELARKLWGRWTAEKRSKRDHKLTGKPSAGTQNQASFHSSKDLMAIVVHILLTQNDPTYFFAPYYAMLPRYFSNFPVFWSDSQLQYLEGSDIVSEIQDRKLGFREDYESLVKAIPEMCQIEGVSFEEFCRVRCLVGSRNFGLRINGQKMTTMVPYADMLNHTRPPQTRWTYENLKQAFTIRSLVEISQRTEVFDSYGPKSNNEYLLFYGFVVKNNRDKDGLCRDVVSLTLSFQSDMMLPKKSRIFSTIQRMRMQKPEAKESKLDETYTSCFELTKGMGSQTRNMLLFLRLKVASSEDLKLFAEQNGLDLFSGEPVEEISGGENSTHERQQGIYGLPSEITEALFSDKLSFLSVSRNSKFDTSAVRPRRSLVEFISPRNESTSLDCLAMICGNLLKLYPHSLEENKAKLATLEETKLAGGTVDYLKEIALIYIISEQEIYQFWIELCRMMKPVFSKFMTTDVDGNYTFAKPGSTSYRALINQLVTLKEKYAKIDFYTSSYLKYLLEQTVLLHRS